ncbi:hypothetical protein EV686_10387 [Paracandidimonas soli]|uniref:Uncharacterized protein n=2 Tax=Paracandidimonas soli TaxID=1917182 RepID=A0A4R3V658_9BURK|nr:hypothetical protein EV686_10387 [Paracandidimonas soli]
MSADWPIRIFYGLVTLYQGLFGIFVPSSIFHQALESYNGAIAIITCLLAAGGLLVVDGLMAMVRYCTYMNCDPIRPAMQMFHRRRPLLFLPPVFCYYVTLILVNRRMDEGVVVVTSYYVVLALAGVAFCLRDGIISQKAQRGTHA